MSLAQSGGVLELPDGVRLRREVGGFLAGIERAIVLGLDVEVRGVSCHLRAFRAE